MKPILITILRWIAVAPAFVVAAVVTRWLSNFTMSYATDYEVVDVVNNAIDFQGHYVLGPLYTFQLCVMMTVAGIWAACATAPTGRQIVRIVLTVLIALFLLVMVVIAFMVPNGEFSTESWVKLCIKGAAIVAATVGSYWLPLQEERGEVGPVVGYKAGKSHSLDLD